MSARTMRNTTSTKKPDGGAHYVEQEAAHEFVVKEKGLDSTGSLK